MVAQKGFERATNENGFFDLFSERGKNALVVIDRFHFFGHIQHAVDACRKQLRKQYPDDTCLKHIKWLLLKNQDRLTQDELATLRALFAVPEFVVLKQVYHAKTRLRQILEEEHDPEQADHRLTVWEHQVRADPKPVPQPLPCPVAAVETLSAELLLRALFYWHGGEP